MTIKRLATACRATVLIAVVANSSAFAAANFWQTNGGSASGFFDVGGFWAAGTPPTAADDANFNLAATYDVLWDNITGNRASNSLSVNNGSVTFRITSGDARTYTIGTGSLNIGNNGHLTLTSFFSTATFTLDISTNLFNIGDGTLTVGANSIANGSTMNLFGTATNPGTINVINGGVLNASLAFIGFFDRGVLNVSGVNSRFNLGGGIGPLLVVGAVGANGHFRVEQGAAASTTGNANIGDATASTGLAEVTDPGSIWTHNGDLHVGRLGNGVLNIQNSASMTSFGTASIGVFTTGNGTVAVTGPGSIWTHNGNLFVGNSGPGILQVQNSGILNSTGSVFVGSSSPGGTVEVAGPGSTWNHNGNLFVGEGGNGALSIQNSGGLTSSGGAASIGTVAGSSGTVQITDPGSTWNHTGDLHVGNAGTGTLQVQNSGTLNSTGLASIGHTATGNGFVTLIGGGANWTHTGDAVVGNTGIGTLFVGADSSANISGNLTIASAANSTGHVEVFGPMGQVSVGGLLLLLGQSKASLTLRDGGILQTGGSFISSPASATVLVTGPGSTWNTNSVRIGVHPGHPTTAKNSLTIGPGGTVNVANELEIGSTGSVTLNGGTLAIRTLNFTDALGINPASRFNFNVGTLHFTVQTAFENLLAQNIFGPSRAITAGRRLIVDNFTVLNEPLTLDGGTFSTGTVFNGNLLSLKTGTLNITLGSFSVSQFGNTLTLNTGMRVNVQAGNTFISAGEMMLLRGGTFFGSGNVINGGEVRLEDTLSQISAGGTLFNTGLVSGRGRIANTLVNQSGGEVRADFTERLQLTGANNLNSALINVNFGGTIESFQGLTNIAAGTISGDGILRVGQLTVTNPAGTPTVTGAGLINKGKMNFSGDTKIFGDVWVEGGDATDVIVSGGATLTFFNDVFMRDTAPGASAPEIRAGNGSHVVYFGLLKGDINATGNGTHHIEGTLSPGFSPGLAQIDGDVVLGDGSQLTIELGGTTPGTAYDRLIVSGDLAAGGTLDVQLMNLFRPHDGDVFDILDFGSLSESFASIHLPTLGSGLRWDSSSLLTTGTLTVVPEPASLGLVMIGGLWLTRRRR